jgi:hypothetical protein
VADNAYKYLSSRSVIVVPTPAPLGTVPNDKHGRTQLSGYAMITVIQETLRIELALRFPFIYVVGI